MPDRPTNGAAEDARKLRRRFRKGVFIIPSLLTTGNIFCGFYSIMESMAGIRSLAFAEVAKATEHFDRAAVVIGFAALFDLLDGRIARMTNATSEFGLELDSIADVVSFGMAPAVLAFAWGYGQDPDLHNVGWAASFLFLICGALRLARFNVQARQPKPNYPPKNPKIDKKAFVGLPIPFAALLIASIAHFSPTPVGYSIANVDLGLMNRSVTIDGRIFGIGLLVLVVSLAFLMVSTMRYSSFKNVGVRNYHPRLVIIALAVVVLAIWFWSRWTVLIISIFYASQGPVSKLWSLVRPRRGVGDVSGEDTSLNPHKL